VKAIVCRLAKLEARFVPREDEQSLLLRERLRRARERLASMGHPVLPPLVYDGPPLSLGEHILWARRKNKIRRGLSNDRCIQILRECGYFQGAGVSIVQLGRIPGGLSAQDTERYLREHGAEVFSPNRPVSSMRMGV
jgi:hypothetical protein